MKKISIVGVLVTAADWILHPVAYYKELQEYRKDFDKEVLNFAQTEDKLRVKIHILTNEKYELERKYAKLKKQLEEMKKNEEQEK